MNSVPATLILLLVFFSFKCSGGFTVAKRSKQPPKGPKGKLGENECRYNTIKILYKIKHARSLQCRHISFPCFNPNYPPSANCSVNRCTVTKKSYPFKTTLRQNKTVCCPGWKKNESSKNPGCSVGTCITLPQFTPPGCVKLRLGNLHLKQRIYRFTNPPPSPPTAEITPANFIQFFKCPLLNLTFDTIAGLAFKNPHEEKWAHVYFALNAVINNFVIHLAKSGKFNNLEKFTDYAKIIDAFQERINGTGLRQYCRFPSNGEDFKDIITDDVWQDDRVFVEQRLAGLNPMSIRMLKMKEYIKRRSQFNPDLMKEIEKVGKETSKMVKEGFVYILDYPAMDNITTMVDATDLNSTDQREMTSSTSPIAIFVSLIDSFSGKRELKPLAIQTDFTASSPVFTPKDGLKWQLAKAIVQRADIQYVEIVEHLVKTHLLLGSVCIAMERHLSKYHPLYDILKYHCRGVLVTNSLAFPTLMYPDKTLRHLFTIGHVGSIEMLNKAYTRVTWKDTNFIAALKKRGVNDARKLPYFPYRDDGIILWKIVREFAKDLVDLYYHNSKFVSEDTELQAFVNELSDKGTGPDGGKGMVKDFPSKIKSKWLLAETFARIIFIPIQHSAVNYPATYYAGFVPNMPTKLYKDPTATGFSIHSIPRGHLANPTVGFTMVLGAMRYDKLFDYHPSLQDKEAARLVEKYYNYLMGPVLKELKSRNKKRFSEGHLTYPYLQPGLVPNSIHV